ncbi:MAG: hypothetical protein ACKV2T_20915 [Kofleriaceae bacterium]
MIRVVLVAMLVAACFSKPGLSSRDSGPGDGGDGDGGQCGQPSGGLTRSTNNFGQVIVGIPTGFSVTFADPASKYPMPIAINVGGEQLISNAGFCTREDQVGIAAYPVYMIAGNQTPTSNIHPLDVDVDGPAYKQLVSHWTYVHGTECQPGNGTVQGNGQTTWGFYPDGRIVRYDYVQPASLGMHQPTSMCWCATSMTWTIASYFAFDQSIISTLTAVGDPEGTTPIPDPPTNPELQNRVGACFTTDANARAGIRWDMSSSGRRDTRIRAFNQITFTHDIVPSSGIGADMTMSSEDTFGLRTHLFLDGSGVAGSCSEVNQRLLRHASTPPARVEGEMIAVDGLGFYDDTIMNRTHANAVTFHADFGSIEDGWALRIKFPGYRSITTSVPSNWQHETDDTFYIFFPDGLENNEMVTITPECPNP